MLNDYFSGNIYVLKETIKKIIYKLIFLNLKNRKLKFWAELFTSKALEKLKAQPFSDWTKIFYLLSWVKLSNRLCLRDL